MEMTQKAEKALTRMVRWRCSRLRPCVKARKNGTAPTGLTMASSAIRGLIKSIDGGDMGNYWVFLRGPMADSPGWGARGRCTCATTIMARPG